ncbi:MAG: ATP-binding protein [Myxococcales bacterium]
MWPRSKPESSAPSWPEEQSGKRLRKLAPRSPRTSWLDRVVTVVLAVSGVALLRWLLHPLVGDAIPLTPFLAAVAIATHRHGARVGYVVALVSVVLGSRLFTESDPHHPYEHLIILLLFMACSALVITIIEREQKTRRALEARDILIRRSYAERERLAEELATSRRLEGLGRLAGGVAHDFNNLLTVILGSAELLKQELPASPLLDGVEVAATRAAELTKQLLGLGRRQTLVLTTLDVASVLRECERLCTRMLPAGFELRIDLGRTPWTFEGDATALQQILMNLVVNARDAMPQGGTITVSSENVILERFDTDEIDLMAGDYVRIRVSDEGTGLDAAVQPHLFEPFYSTKGQGTGLGLAVVYGLSKQLRGSVRAHNNTDKGASFDLYLPRSSRFSADSGVVPRTKKGVAGRSLRVLMVEDNALVQRTLRSILESLGHRVVIASNGEAALAIMEREPRALDVVLSDVVMPGMDGLEVAEEAGKLSAKIGVVLISGYTDADVWKRLGQNGIVFLRKPFSSGELNDALDRATHRGAGARTG